jgi:CBS domain-containing protein
MSGHRGDWDEDFYEGEPRPRGRHGEGSHEGPGGAREAARRYEYDERDAVPARRGWGPRDDDDERGGGRGEYYRDEYYAARPRVRRDFSGAREYERERRREIYPPPHPGFRPPPPPPEFRPPPPPPDFRPPPPPPGYARRGAREEYRRARGAPRSHLRCRDIMTRDVTVAARTTTLEEVARMMRDEDTGVIPVVEPGETTSDSVTEVQKVPARPASNGKLVGLVTDRDIVVRALAEGRDAREVLAEEVMTTELHNVRPNDRVIEAIRLMGDRQVRRLPVVDREGNLRGIISMADIALETEADREIAEALEEISSGSSFWSRIFS